MTVKKRTWDQKRLRVLRQCLMVASVAQGFPGWFSVTDFMRVFQGEVGQMCRRTAQRYLCNLEMCGLLEEKRVQEKTG